MKTLFRSSSLAIYIILLIVTQFGCTINKHKQPYDGFKEFSWGTDLETINKVIPLRILDNEKKVKQCGTNIKQMFGIEVKSCVLGFYNDKLFCVSIFFDSSYNYPKVMKYVNNHYKAKPSSTDTTDSIITNHYNWPTPNTNLDLYLINTTGEGGYYLYSVDIQDSVIRR